MEYYVYKHVRLKDGSIFYIGKKSLTFAKIFRNAFFLGTNSLCVYRSHLSKYITFNCMAAQSIYVNETLSKRALSDNIYYVKILIKRYCAALYRNQLPVH